MIVPTTAEQYGEYAVTRSNLALPSGDLLPLNYTDNNGVNYGLHPSMPEIANLFNTGRGAAIANIGTLIEPVTQSQVWEGTAPLPLGLQSHADQVRHWQTSIPQSRSAKGWGGKVADILAAGNSNQDISMNISLAGTNLWQAGNTVDEFTITKNGSVGIDILEDNDPFAVLVGEGIQNILDQTYSDVLKQTYADKVKASQNQHDVFTQALAALNPLTSEFPNNNFSKQMKMIAESIAIAGDLGMARQTYYIKLGGFDNHGELLNNHADRMSILSAAIGAFYESMDEIGMSDQVTTFTISDFARTLTSNDLEQTMLGEKRNGVWESKRSQIYGQYLHLL